MNVEQELIFLSHAPSEHVKTYNSMWAYGIHYRVDLEDNSESHSTYDSGVAFTSRQTCRSSSRDHNVVIANLKYVGVLKEILVVSYSASFNVVLFRGSWVPPHVIGRNHTMKRDDYGFWLVKLGRRLPPDVDPYVFPSIVSQVFFVRDHVSPDWFVVLQEEPRSRHVFGRESDCILGADYEGEELTLPEDLSECQQERGRGEEDLFSDPVGVQR